MSLTYFDCLDLRDTWRCKIEVDDIGRIIYTPWGNFEYPRGHYRETYIKIFEIEYERKNLERRTNKKAGRISESSQEI
jgi:hypothetical protein